MITITTLKRPHLGALPAMSVAIALVMLAGPLAPAEADRELGAIE